MQNDVPRFPWADRHHGCTPWLPGQMSDIYQWPDPCEYHSRVTAGDLEFARLGVLNRGRETGVVNGTSGASIDHIDLLTEVDDDPLATGSPVILPQADASDDPRPIVAIRRRYVHLHRKRLAPVPLWLRRRWN